MNLLNLPLHRSHKVLKPLWELWAWCWPGPAAEDDVSTSRDRLRRFLLLKLVTVLFFPHRAGLSLLLGCPFSLKALLLLRSPHISTKPSTVFLWQLALTDGLLLLHWTLNLGHRLTQCLGVGFDNDLIQELFWFKEAVSVFCQCLLDAHLLASLLFLGLLGLEATLVSRWPLQTRAIRTSHWAQLGCTLVWALVLFELLIVVYSKLQTSQSLSSLALLSSVVSFCLRRTLWLCDLWLHYNIIYNKPQKRRSSFH